MSVIRCARTAAAVGRMHEQDAKAMERLWLREFEGAKAGGMAPGAAETHANNQVRGAVARIAQHSRIVAQLTQEALERWREDAGRFRNRKGQMDAGEFALQTVNHIHFRSQAGFKLDLAELGAMIQEFRRTPVSGLRHNRTRMDLVVREIHGEDTGDPLAKQFAQAWAALSRRKIQQFNAAGGNVSLRTDWHLPQVHDGLSIARAGLDEWKDYIHARVDMTAMTNPRTGKAFTATEFEDFLDVAYQNITWHGAGGEATLAGEQGTATWRRHADPRFLVFKDAASWLEYSEKFGAGSNPFEVMTGYLRAINHDLAAMQMLGPNPSAVMRYIAGDHDNPGGFVLEQGRLASEGKPAIFPTHGEAIDARDALGVGKFKGNQDRQRYAADKALGAQRAWRVYTGEAKRPGNPTAAQVQADVTNLMYAKLLAFTPFIVGGDIVNQAASRAFRSVSVSGMMRDMVDAFRLSTDRQALAELSVEIDVGLSTMWSEARDHAAVQGSPWSRTITDRALTYTGLKPMTLGMRAMWTMGMLHDLTKHASKAFRDLPPNFRSMLERYDIDAQAWEFVRAAPITNNRGVHVIRPGDIANVSLVPLGVHARPGLTAGQEVATRILTMIQEEGESAVVSGTPRSARFLAEKPGTIKGAWVGSFEKLKAYSISHFQQHAFRSAEIFWRNGGGIRGTGSAGLYYFGALLLPSMILVGAGSALSEVLKGRNPPDMTDSDFISSTFWKTVSLGFSQDIIRGATDADNPVQQASMFGGPLISTATDGVMVAHDALAELGAAASGEEADAHLGRHTLKFARDFIPRHWATDLATERLIWDNLQRHVDPEAEEDFRRRANAIPQGQWWAPGEEAPRQIQWDTMDLAGQRDSSVR